MIGAAGLASSDNASRFPGGSSYDVLALDDRVL